MILPPGVLQRYYSWLPHRADLSSVASTFLFDADHHPQTGISFGSDFPSCLRHPCTFAVKEGADGVVH